MRSDRTQSAPVLATALLVALTGCLGGGNGAAETANVASPTGAADLANATVPDPDAPAGPPAPVSVDASYSGETGTWACYFVVAVQGCQGQFSSTANRELAYSGSPLRIVGTLTWQAGSPATSELQVRVLPMNGTDVDYSAAVLVARGTSPLSVDGDLTALAGGLLLDVSSAHEQSSPAAGLTYSTAQAFEFAGNFTYRPPA